MCAIPQLVSAPLNPVPIAENLLTMLKGSAYAKKVARAQFKRI